jgi:hypothetical protein
MADQEVAQRLTGAQHDQQALTELRVGHQQVDELGGAEPLADRRERREGGVRAGHSGDLVDQGVGHVAQSHEVAHRAVTVAEALASQCQGELTRVSSHLSRLPVRGAAAAPAAAGRHTIGRRRSSSNWVTWDR